MLKIYIYHYFLIEDPACLVVLGDIFFCCCECGGNRSEVRLIVVNNSHNINVPNN